MSRIAGRSLTTFVVAAALLLGAPDTIAASGVGGAYTASVVLGPLLLDGRYPLTVGESSPGTLDVTTSAKGVLSARVTFAAQTEEAVGRISVRSGAIRLTLRGTVDVGRIAVSATLRGGAFVGTVKLRGAQLPCRIDVTGVGPLLARYDLDITTAANGAVTGTGTVTVGRERNAVTVRGRARKDRVTLRAQGAGTSLQITAAEFETGAVRALKWKAKGFGAAVRNGRPVVLDPN